MTTLYDGLKMLLEEKKWADCIFHFPTYGNNEIKAHQLILATASPVFRAMFYGEMANNGNNENKANKFIPGTARYGFRGMYHGGMADTVRVEIEDIRPEIFKLMLDFIYIERYRLPYFEAVYDLFYAAEKYMLWMLKKLCVWTMMTCLNASNACKSYELAKLFNIPTLVRRAEMMILLTETSAVLASKSIADVQFSTLLMILDHKELNISSESELFDAVKRWGRKECKRRGLPGDSKNLRDIVEPALKKINFLTFTLEEFVKGTADSPIFTDNESLCILRSIVHRSAKFPMLDGFSGLTEKRRAGSFDRLFPDEPKIFEQKPYVNECDEWPQGICERFKYLLQSEQFTDCSFPVEEEGNDTPRIYRAHWLILSMISANFRDMWSSAKMSDSYSVKIVDMNPDTFKRLLDFIYTDECDLPDSDEIYELSVAAHTFRLPLLVDQCVSKLISIRNTSNAFKIYETLECLKEGSDELHDTADFILSHTSKILREPSFEDVDFPLLSALLNSPALTISSEAELFKATMRWARKECQRRALPEDKKNLRAVSDVALKSIRFLAFTTEEFVEGPAKCEILSEKERLHILVNIVKPSAKFPMPEGFSTEGERDYEF